MSNHLRNAKYVSSITILRFGDWIPRALGGGQLKYYWNFHHKTWGFMIQFDYNSYIFPMGWPKTTNSACFPALEEMTLTKIDATGLFGA